MFTDRMKELSFKVLSVGIYKSLKESSCKALLLGNVQLGAFDYDAILFCENHISIFEFKEGWGKITVMREGPWLKGHKEIWSGFDKINQKRIENPLVQLKSKRNVLYGYLNKYLKLRHDITCYICFERNITVTDSCNILTKKAPWLNLNSIKNVAIQVQDDTLNEANDNNDKAVKNWDELFNRFRVVQSFNDGSTRLTPDLKPNANVLLKRLLLGFKRMIK